MLYCLQSLRGLIAGLLILINLLFFGIPVIVLGLIKFVSKNMKWRVFWTHPIVYLCARWGDVCVVVESIFARIDWDIEIDAQLDTNKPYLVICNHQSNADIPVLLKAVHGQIPFMRFFTKASLKKLPIFGFAWQAVDCPFMGRYTKEQIQADPSLKQKDLNETIATCQIFKHLPFSIVNFVEGTRFTKAKHEKYQSPYQHLLPARAGGTAYALAALEGRLETFLDITIYFHGKSTSLWDYFCGRIPKISVRVEEKAIPKHFSTGDYFNDDTFRSEFQGYMNELWARKDQMLDEIHKSSH